MPKNILTMNSRFLNKVIMTITNILNSVNKSSYINQNYFTKLFSRGIIQSFSILLLLLISFSSWDYAIDPDKTLPKAYKENTKLEKALLMPMVMLEPTSCYAVDDNSDHLIKINKTTAAQVDYGSINATSLEAIITSINGDIIYGANAGTWGSINISNATFNAIGTFGSGFGDQGTLSLNDVDGLALDVTTGIYYGAHRSGDGSSPEDVLFKFNPLTGAVIQNGFGTDEYVSIEATTFNGSTYYDIDDISVHPITGVMYGIANQNAGTMLLVEIDKTDGSTTLIGKINNAASTFNGDVEGLSVYNDGTFYVTTGNTPGKLYSIDISTALVTEIGQFTVGGDYEGLACLTQGYITANDDSSYGNVIGSSVTLNIIANDITNANNQPLNINDVTIDLNPAIAGNQISLIVPGEGTWQLLNGSVTFTPISGFEDDPTPIDYIVTINSNGASSTAKIDIGYVNCDTSSPNSNVIFGSVFNDNNVDQTYDSNETGHSNIIVELFEDFNQNNIADGAAIRTTTTNSIGDYEFTLNDLVFSTDDAYNDKIVNGCNDAKNGDNNDSELKLGKSDNIGVLFEGITIPSGANINSAFVYFTAEESKNEAGSSLNIYGNDTANPADYCVNSNVTNRTKTTNNIPWTIPNLWSVNQEYSSPNIALVITELIGSYSYNNADLSLILIATGNKDKKAYSYEGSTSKAPRLEINYTIPGNTNYTYLISTNSSSYPQGGQLTTDNIEIATFTSQNVNDCDNLFGINEPPVAVNNEDLNNVAYSVVNNINIVSNDTDPNNNQLNNTVSLDPSSVGGGVGSDTDSDGDIDQVVGNDGTWQVDENGIVTFTPDINLFGNPDVIEYTIDDLASLSSNEATITITYLFHNPVAGDDSNAIPATPGNDVTINLINNDSDVDNDLNISTINFDPVSVGGTGFDTDNDGDIDSVYIAGQGSYVVDETGIAMFIPINGFDDDPSPIDYTIKDKTGLQSNVATITVDYVPLAVNDISTGNTTNTNVTVNALVNDTGGDIVDPTSVALALTGLPVDATCTSTDANGDCVEVTIPDQGVYSVNETTGAITFDPQDGFTANPDPITYSVKDHENNATSAVVTIEYIAQPPTATDNESLANPAGNVTQQVVTEDDGDGVDADPDGSLTIASVDLDLTTAGIQSSLIVAGEGTWSVDGAGNVTFAPQTGFTTDPTPISYTISDNDWNTSNVADIIVDYVPVATNDLSSGNTTNTNVTVNVLSNDTDGDLTDPASVSLALTGLPVDATCTATDVAGDCIEVTIPDQGVYSVNETTGAITFDPELGFTANPDPITYSVKDDEGNVTSALVTITYTPQPPTATDNESLANPAGNVVQQIVTEDDGDGVDADPDGNLTLVSVDLDPATPGIQSSLMVAAEGTWSVDGAGNVTFAPEAGFTLDPTTITYTINDNDGNTSNSADIVVDYVPVATNDLSSGNITNTNVTVDILENDTDGDTAEPTTVFLVLAGLPVDATCTATDVAGDCIEVTIPGQGVYSVNETTGAITFDPEIGFTANPDPITYSVKDDEGNVTSALVTILYDGCLKLNLRVYLEGALINNAGATGAKGPLMRDNLRSSPYEAVIHSNFIPVEEPYTSLVAFNHTGEGGGEMATETAFDLNGENSVVDWVFIELRDKTDSTSVLFTRSALLQRDGDVVDVDGVSPLLWCALPDDTYYIVVRHRNHLGVMSALPEILTVEGTEVDFTNGNSELSGEYNFGLNHPVGGLSEYDYTGLSQKSYLGVRTLWLGNSSHQDKVKYESPGDDKSQILFDVLFYPTNNTFQGAYDFGFGYHNGDLNMDSKAKYEAPFDDQSILLFQILFYPLNNTFQSAFDFMYEQIPNN
ncbi:MAG: CshA-type fibril repeat protein [Saprospiraceae bacterium]|jgi:CshA-type fibril repeat protein